MLNYQIRSMILIKTAGSECHVRRWDLDGSRHGNVDVNRVALVASLLVMPALMRAQQSPFRDECTGRIEQVEGGRPRAGALIKLAECGPVGGPVLARHLRTAALRSDTVYLAELREALLLVRDSSVLRAALAVATDPAASPEGRITALFVALAQDDSLVALRPGVGFATILADSLEARCQLTIDRDRPKFRWTTRLPPATPWLVATAANAVAASPGPGGLRLFARCVLAAVDGETAVPAAAFGGVVRDTAGRPLPNADVVGLSSRMRARTDGSGRFFLGDLGPGPELFLVRSIGFAPQRVPATLAAGDTMSVDVVLGSSPQQLADLTVQAFGHEYRGKMAQGEARHIRMAAAAASSVIGPAEIEAWGKFDLANVFRRAGLDVHYNSISCPVRGSIGPPADIDVYLDDALVGQGPEFDITTFPVQWISTALVFKRMATVPIEYQRLGAGCVVILLSKG